MMQARVQASSHYLEAVQDAGLASLGDALAEVCRRRFRRVDRCAQLALLGSGRCARGHQLDPQTGIYMASALGPVGSNARVQQAMLREREWPRPFDFINTLGGSAGFYVAANLGLAGPNLFLGGPHGLFDAMRMALVDLAAGVVPRALVGVVEECPLPLAGQRRRLGVGVDTTLGEGSHWWLLGPQVGSGPVLTRHDFSDAGQPEPSLRDVLADAPHVGLAPHVEAAFAAQVRHACAHVEDVTSPRLPRHASPAAAWLGESCDTAPAVEVTLIGPHELLRVNHA